MARGRAASARAAHARASRRSFEAEAHAQIDRQAIAPTPADSPAPSRVVDPLGRLRAPDGQYYAPVREGVPAGLVETATWLVVDGQCGPECRFCPMMWLGAAQAAAVRRLVAKGRRLTVDEWRSAGGAVLAYIWDDVG